MEIAGLEKRLSRLERIAQARGELRPSKRAPVLSYPKSTVFVPAGETRKLISPACPSGTKLLAGSFAADPQITVSQSSDSGLRLQGDRGVILPAYRKWVARGVNRGITPGEFIVQAICLLY